MLNLKIYDAQYENMTFLWREQAFHDLKILNQIKQVRISCYY